MARPLRIEAPGMWYHVINRGNERGTVFFDDGDYALFLTQLAESCARYQVELHAYAVLSNHFHLLVRTRTANLGRFMQRLLTAYSIAGNLKHGRSGHVFQGRYTALVVEQNTYGATVSRYIHVNPVATLAGTQSWEAKRAGVRAYRWSSYGAYLGIVPAHPALVREDTLARFGKNKRAQQQAYAAFVEEGLLKGVEDPRVLARAQLVLGKDRFMEKIRRMLLQRKEKDAQAERSRARLVAPAVAAVVRAVAQAYRTTEADIIKKASPARAARRAALWLASTTCVGRTSLKEIGARFGISTSAVVQTRKRMAAAQRSDARLRRHLQKLAKLSTVNA